LHIPLEVGYLSYLIDAIKVYKLSISEARLQYKLNILNMPPEEDEFKFAEWKYEQDLIKLWMVLNSERKVER
jgi:hypothetical protein